MNVTIREARIEDSRGIALVHLHTWQNSYRGIFPDEKLDSYSLEDSIKQWEEQIKSNNSSVSRILVADDSEHLITGFVRGGTAGLYDKESYGYDCEIFAIYVLNDHQRKGIGSLLVKHMLEFFQRMEWKSMIIWTLEKSPYREFYAKLGGIPKKVKTYLKWGANYELFGYVWEDISTVARILQNN